MPLPPALDALPPALDALPPALDALPPALGTPATGLSHDFRRDSVDFRRDVVEFLLVGGATLLFLPLFWLFEKVGPIDEAEYRVSFLAFYAAYIINDPHFSVSYVLFYRRLRQRALDASVSLVQRIRYWVAGLVVPAALAVWCVLAVQSQSAERLGLLFQVMFFLVSWHYAKQAFGILMTLSARRQVRFSTLERRLILAHCLAAWFFARAYPRDSGSDFMEQGVVFHSFPHPTWLLPLTSLLFGLSTVGLVLAVACFVRRTQRLPPVGAFLAFLVSVWIWTIFTNLSSLLIYVIPALHSIQYLYFVYLQRRNEARAFEGEPHFGRPVATQLGLLAATALALGWLMFHGLPETLDELFAGSDPDAAGELGPTPYMAAFLAFINIHHYFMDAAMWRREVPETKYLMD